MQMNVWRIFIYGRQGYCCLFIIYFLSKISHRVRLSLVMIIFMQREGKVHELISIFTEYSMFNNK